MTTLAIRTHRCIGYHLLVEGTPMDDGGSWYRDICRLPFRDVSSRVDPITRAWERIEAKWGMR